ncbi:MAG: succinylglutamate desuccinylase/aspartoacylase family protein [Bryobacterales bacterium]|nr:succinylglutamate desuccinylase/aspartoacylase family protein [Bryobacterales bacterium]
MNTPEPNVIVCAPGELDLSSPGKRHYQIAFPLDSSWGYSLLPFTVIRGTRTTGCAATAGGVVAFGGTHGNEYEGQVAVKQLCQDLEADAIRGTVFLFPQLSESACRAHTRCSPLDGVNMNRAFPGKERGSISERIASFVKREIFPRVNVVLDLHAGGNEAVFPVCASIHRVPDPQQQEEMLRTAALFDTPFIFLYSRQMASGLLTDEAEDDGKIAIGGEFGAGETVDATGLRHAREGVRNVLRSYGMLDEAPRRVRPPSARHPVLIEAPNLRDYIATPMDGIWEPCVLPGDTVEEGQIIGRIHNFTNHASQPLPVLSHRAGTVIALYRAAVCRKGLSLYVVGDAHPLELKWEQT